MIIFENNVCAGYGFLKNENELLVDGKTIAIKNLDCCQAFYSNSIFFIGVKEGDTLALLEVDDLPLENTISELGKEFLPIIQVDNYVACVLMTRKCKFPYAQGMKFIEMKSQDGFIQADVTYMEEEEFKALENEECLFIVGEDAYVSKKDKTIFYQNAKIIPIRV